MMKPTTKSAPFVVLMAVALAANARSPVENATTTAPSPGPAVHELYQELIQTRGLLKQMLSDPQAVSDPTKRAAVAPAALGRLARVDRLCDAIAKGQPQSASQMQAVHDETLACRSALGDSLATQTIAAMTADADSLTAVRGHVMRLNVQWLQAGPDAAVQEKVVDAIEPLARTQPRNSAITQVVSDWATKAATPELADRLFNAAAAMDNAAVQRVAGIKQQVESIRKLKAMENQPFVLTGTTADGAPFSTADYQGKVVVIDFWATWCGPCKAELPDLKALYEKYHAAGLEVVGISNDFSVDTLKQFCATDQIPWPQLYDATAGRRNQCSPITLGYGITTIPHMFVIDRHGKLLDSDARDGYRKRVADAIAQHD